MLRAAFVALIGALVGLACGWNVHQSRYGGEATFGPFATDNDVTAESVAVALASSQQSGSPRIEVIGGEEYDFGVMEPGAKGTHHFVVKNTGDFPLSLEIVGSTCKCTIGELAKSSIGPGEETEIELTWDVKSSDEEFGQSAILKTNDPTRGELNLKIKGRVISKMTMVPRSFNFGEIVSGEAIQLESIVYSFATEPIVPLKQSFTGSDFDGLASFEVEEVSVAEIGDEVYSTATQAFRVRGTVKPGLPQGSIQQNFVFSFASQSAVDADGQHAEDAVRYFSAPIAGKVVGAITMVTSRRVQGSEGGGYTFIVGRFNPATDEPVKANVMLRDAAGEESLRLEIGEILPEGVLRAELGEPVGRGALTLYPLSVWIDPQAKPIERMGKSDDDFGIIWIKTNRPEVSPLRLKVAFATAQ